LFFSLLCCISKSEYSVSLIWTTTVIFVAQGSFFCILYSSSDASFAESLYGLRRRAVKIRVKKEDARPKSGDGIQHSGLEKHQRILSVVFLVPSSASFS